MCILYDEALSYKLFYNNDHDSLVSYMDIYLSLMSMRLKYEIWKEAFIRYNLNYDLKRVFPFNSEIRFQNSV